MKKITINLQPLFLTIIPLFMITSLSAQVGIGTPDPQAQLDIRSSNQGTPANNDGILIPKIDNFPGANPTATRDGMLVFVTGSGVPNRGFYYWDQPSTSWIGMGSDDDKWSLSGNVGTGGEILGTTNGDDLRIWAGGSERQRIMSNGQILMNMGAPVWINDVLSVEGIYAVNGYTTSVTGIGVYGEGTFGGDGVVGVSTTGIGTYGSSTSLYGVFGFSNNNVGTVGQGLNFGVVGDVGSGVGVQGQAISGIGTVGLATSGDGVWGISTSGEGIYGESDSGDGVWGSSDVGEGVYGNSVSGDGIWGISTSGDGVYGYSNSGDGVWGISISGTGVFGASNGVNFFGGEFSNSDPNGHGLIASGNGLAGSIIPATGAGITGTGSKYGTFGFSDGTSSTGVIGVANGLGTFSTIAPNGSGVSGTGTDVGMAGFSTANDGLGVFGQGGNNANGIGVQGQGTYGVVGISGTGNGDLGVYGEGKIGVLGQAASTTGSNNYGVFSNGDFGGSGAKYFMIDHPLNPSNKFLKHANIESNEILNLYRGTETFDGSGKVKVQLPNYYDAINKNPSYQLTPIGASMPNLFIEQEVENGAFIIAGGIPGKKVSWQITSERNDPYLKLNPEKRSMEVDKGSLSGKYLMPELYGKSIDLSIFNTPASMEHEVTKTSSASSKKNRKRSDKVKKTKEVSKLEIEAPKKKQKSKE